jgi:hypothetical protein
MKVGFIGVGKLGMPCAEAVAQKGHDVSAYDVMPRTSEYVNVKESITETVKDRDIVFIAVPTPHDPLYDGNAPTAHLTPKDFGYDTVVDVIKEDADETFRQISGLEQDTFVKTSVATKNRAVWLGLNLITAFIAASFIDIFNLFVFLS